MLNNFKIREKFVSNNFINWTKRLEFWSAVRTSRAIERSDVCVLMLDALVDKGNTVLVVEHNTDVINHSDWVIELGPEGGALGGEVVFEGTPKNLKKNKKSPTAKFL